MKEYKQFRQSQFFSKKILCFLFIILFSVNCFSAQRLADLFEKINEIEKASNTIVGISAVNIETNNKVDYNGTLPFLMASTVKLPIALLLLHRVDENEDSLERVIHLNRSDAVPGSGDLYHVLEKHSIQMTLKQLLKTMLIDSDNSASDVVLREVGGSNAVAARMKFLGCQHIFVNRSIFEIYLDMHGVDRLSMKKTYSSDFWKKKFDDVPLENKIIAWQGFEKDWRDTATPEDMKNLLVALYKGELLSPASTDLLMDIMKDCKTGKSSIKGLLPTNTISCYRRNGSCNL